MEGWLWVEGYNGTFSKDSTWINFKLFLGSLKFHVSKIIKFTVWRNVVKHLLGIFLLWSQGQSLHHLIQFNVIDRLLRIILKCQRFLVLPCLPQGCGLYSVYCIEYIAHCSIKYINIISLHRTVGSSDHCSSSERLWCIESKFSSHCMRHLQAKTGE